MNIDELSEQIREFQIHLVSSMVTVDPLDRPIYADEQDPEDFKQSIPISELREHILKNAQAINCRQIKALHFLSNEDLSFLNNSCGFSKHKII